MSNVICSINWSNKAEARWLGEELIQAMHRIVYTYYLIFILILSHLALEISIV